ncbi:glutamate racemase [Kordiimonas sp. SCSIO 12610]|uniref:glutamate racemase n=1 Tax=Kordiimonas sp. SCSIO 12610 TaxID=2829597 RepID=UPI00210D9FC8|nr:glutamate racemase [Kordiimonas sp. SCSIO 12610]UTW55002.1 glutamate racemase [Kordiimonas sp. SCSIO 12610]
MIGVFDSGSGGLTVLEALQKQFPNQDFIYLGDHANAPYGHRSNEQIVEFTKAGVDTLMQNGCKLVILACNTAAAVALRTLQQNWLEHAHPGKRILGVLVPMVEAITGVPWSKTSAHLENHPPHKNIAVFATRKTIESKAYDQEVRKRAPGITLFSKACPGLVDAIEGGAGDLPVKGLISGYVQELLAKHNNIDAALLGCTHFPLVKSYFEEALGKNIKLLSQPTVVAEALQSYLQAHPEFAASGDGITKIMTTGNVASTTALDAYCTRHSIKLLTVD